MENEEDDEGYIPEPIGISEGECIILDPAEFEMKYNADAILMSGGVLFYLEKDSRQWVNIETKPGTRKVRSVQ
jgi:hypothetical protein